jgi:hypothetical protein
VFDQIRKLIADRLAEVNVAMPGIIRAFNADNQTVKVDVAIKKLDGTIFTQLVDVPLCFPTCSGFSLTMPVVAGDECHVVFADRCIDNWFTRGGVQDQAEHRTHDIADGFAILGINSTPRKVASYNTTAMELRNAAGDQYIRLKPNKDIELSTPADVNAQCNNANVNATVMATVIAPNIKLQGAVEITGTLLVNGVATLGAGAVGAAGAPLQLTGGVAITGTATANSKNIGSTHTHSGVTTGLGNTGVPV